jgi:hypothetical protein
MTKYFAILLLGLVAGCSSAPSFSGRESFVLRSREVVLSRQHPQDDFLKARLVAIADDGATTIQVIDTGDTLRAVPGDFFAPGPYGIRGLKLISASAEKHEVHLLLTWCGPE